MWKQMIIYLYTKNTYLNYNIIHFIYLNLNSFVTYIWHGMYTVLKLYFGFCIYVIWMLYLNAYVSVTLIHFVIGVSLFLATRLDELVTVWIGNSLHVCAHWYELFASKWGDDSTGIWWNIQWNNTAWWVIIISCD